jgi:hypothetical protein
MSSFLSRILFAIQGRARSAFDRCTYIVAFLLFAVLWPHSALAQAASGPVKATSLGDIFCNAKAAGAGYPYILVVACYIIGAILAVRAILLFKQHAENPSQPKIVPGIAHFFGAGCFMSFPVFAGVIQRTILGSAGGNGTNNCMATTLGGGATGLDQMMQNFVKNIHDPMFSLLSIISIVVGLTFLAKGLLAGTRIGTDPRAASPKTIIVNLVIGALLLSIGTVLTDTLGSLFGSTDIKSFSGIAWSNIGVTGVNTTAADNTVKAILAFVQVIGGISFLRGWLIVKTAVEGGGQATIPQGVTHIVGGAMAINIGAMLKIFDVTFGTNTIN